MRKERKSEFIRFRATKTEVRMIKDAAKLRGITLSNLLRLAIADFLRNHEVKHEQSN